jgi:hypothetical protein
LVGAWIARDPRESRAGNSLGHGPHAARIADMPTRRSRGQAGARAEQRGYYVCSVVNENGIVLGVIGKRDWDTDPTASVEQLMDSAPTLCVRAIRWKRRNSCSRKPITALCSSPTQTESCSAHFLAPRTMQKPAANSRGPQSEARSRSR